jgi:hypothetical protein
MLCVSLHVKMGTCKKSILTCNFNYRVIDVKNGLYNEKLIKSLNP